MSMGCSTWSGLARADPKSACSDDVVDGASTVGGTSPTVSPSACGSSSVRTLAPALAASLPDIAPGSLGDVPVQDDVLERDVDPTEVEPHEGVAPVVLGPWCKAGGAEG